MRWLAVAVCLMVLVRPSAAAPPNIVLFLVDDMGVMDTSVPCLTDAEGEPVRHPLNDLYRTPNMQRLAALGVRFSQFYAMSVCSPTRISIMTGQNAARHRTTNWIDPDRNNGGVGSPPEWNWPGLNEPHDTLPELLREAGYRTIHVGKGHFAPQSEPGHDPRQLGFDINIGGGPFGMPGSYYGRLDFAGVGPRRRYAVPDLEEFHGSDLFLTEALTRRANRELERAVADGQPFFLHMSHYAVHAPFESDPRFADHYAKFDLPEPAKAFATLVEGMDQSLGDILDQLERLGVAEQTLVLFLGDNGGDAPLGGPHDVASSAPLRGRKGSHYEGGMRVPMLAAWGAPAPKLPHQQRLPIPANAVQTQIASVEDLLPTLLGVAGVPLPADRQIDGRDMSRLLCGERDPERPERFLMHYPHQPHRSNHFSLLRQGRWKLVYHYFPTDDSDGRHVQLFDLEVDPAEQHNVAAEHPERSQRMLAELVAALDAHDALYPVDPNTQEPQRPRAP